MRKLTNLEINLPSKTLFQVRILFSKDSWKDLHWEQQLATHALNFKKVGPIYTAVILQLLNANIIQNSNLDISLWIKRNIYEDPMNLDKSFLRIMQIYVKGIYSIEAFTPLPDSIIESLKFTPRTVNDVSKQVLILYYCLLRNSKENLNYNKIKKMKIDQSIIANLMKYVNEAPKCTLLRAITPHLYGLIMSQYSELVDPTNYHYKRSLKEK